MLLYYLGIWWNCLINLGKFNLEAWNKYACEILPPFYRQYFAAQFRTILSFVRGWSVNPKHQLIWMTLNMWMEKYVPVILTAVQVIWRYFKLDTWELCEELSTMTNQSQSDARTHYRRYSPGIGILPKPHGLDLYETFGSWDSFWAIWFLAWIVCYNGGSPELKFYQAFMEGQRNPWHFKASQDPMASTMEYLKNRCLTFLFWTLDQNGRNCCTFW